MSRWLKSNATQRERAARRDAACRAVRDGLLPCGGICERHLACVAARYKVTAATVRRWMVDFTASDSVEARIDAPRSGRPAQIWALPGAEQAWNLWLTDYLRLSRPTAAECLRRLMPTATARQWKIPRNTKSFFRRLNKEVPIAEIIRAREGAMAMLDTVPAQERSVAGMQPLDIINGDGKRHDVWVVLPGGQAGRPLVWYWQDIRTRKILSYSAGETENAEMVRVSLHDLIIEHGVPKRVLVDNTRSASNKMLTGKQTARRRWKSSDEEIPGILFTLGIDYSTTIIDRNAVGKGAGRGRSKPIERAFADVAHYIDTHPLADGAYMGKSPMRKPEDYCQRAIDWATFTRLLAEGVAEYNARVGRRTEAAAGRSFDETWNDEISQTVIRRLSAAQAAMLLLAVESSKIKTDGTFTLKAGRGSGLPKNRYHHISLVDRAGENLIVRFDPKDLHTDNNKIHVFDKDDRYICAANCIMKIGFSDTDAAREHERQRRSFRKSTEKGLAARRNMDALLDAQEVAPLAPVRKAKPAALRVVNTSPEIPTPASQRRTERTRQDRRATMMRGIHKRLAESR